MHTLTLKATPRDWLGLAVLVVASLLVAMDLSVLLFAVPEISRLLQPSGTELLWIIDIYGFTLAGLLITMGTLGDRIGRRKLLMLGAGLFAAASLAAAFAPNSTSLIALRALLGIGGATLAPSTLGLIRNMFHDDRQRQTAIAIWTAGFAGGAGFGPILGGFLLQHFWWGSVFLVNVPVMLLVVAAAPFLLSESRDPNPGRFDILSALLSLGAVLTAIFGIKELAANGLALLPALSLAVGIVLGFAFIRRQRRLTTPLIDLHLFAIPSFSAAMFSNAICMFAMLGISLFNVQYLLGVLGIEPFPAALWSLAPALAVPVGITIATIGSKFVGKSALLGTGLAVAGAGMMLIGRVDAQSGLFVFLGTVTVMTIGIGIVSALSTDMVMAAAPKEKASAASALSETGTELSGALGIALLGTLAAAVFHGAMTGLVPAGLPDAVAIAAQSTLGGAIAAAEQLGGTVGEAFLATAHHAFMSAMSATATVGGAVLILSAIVVVRVLRKAKITALAAAE